MPNEYAIIDAGGTVDNTVLWDGSSAWPVPSGFTAVRIDTLDPKPGVGWTYNGTTFSPPSPAPPPPDPQGFTAAILQSSASNSEKGYLLTALPALVDELNLADPSLIAAGWATVKASGELSSGTITIVVGLAATYNIPGIS